MTERSQSWEESMAPGIDMLHHFGPLMRSKSQSTHGLLDGDGSKDSFDYGRFRRHFVTLFDRIVRLASSSADEQVNQEATAAAMAKETAPTAEAPEGTQPVDEIGNLERMLCKEKLGPVARAGKPNLSSSLEAVEDDEEEYDEEDLRDTGYRKDYGPTAAPAGEDDDEQRQQKQQGKRSEWVNEDFELPTTEELFSDLGIWW